MKRVLSLIVLIVLSSNVFATSYICTHDNSTREIEVVYSVEGQTVPCSVVYRKAEGEQTLWSAQGEEGYCEAKAQAFADKQKGWGWDCTAKSAPAAGAMPEAAKDDAEAPATEE